MDQWISLIPSLAIPVATLIYVVVGLRNKSEGEYASRQDTRIRDLWVELDKARTRLDTCEKDRYDLRVMLLEARPGLPKEKAPK